MTEYFVLKISNRAPKTRDGETQIWRLRYLEAAAREGRKTLDDIQYAYAVEAFDEIAFARNPRAPETHDVKPIHEFFELRDKGGHLGKINLRVYFSVHDQERQIVVLSVYKKEDDGQAPARIVRRARNRLRHVKLLLEQEQTSPVRESRRRN